MTALRQGNGAAAHAGMTAARNTWGVEGRVTDRLTRLGRARDGLLVGATALYALGYAVWALHAARNGLGLLPVLQVQYLVAGLPVATVLVAWFASIRLTSAVTEFVVAAARGGRPVAAGI